MEQKTFFLPFIDDSKLGRDASTLEDRDNILNDFDKLQKWSKVCRVLSNKKSKKIPLVIRCEYRNTQRRTNSKSPVEWKIIRQ